MPKTDDDLPAKSVSSVRPAGIASTQKYDAAQIDKLEGLEAVRKRPGIEDGRATTDKYGSGKRACHNKYLG